MSKANSTENALLLLIFNATTWDLIAENDTTSPATNLYVALHTSDPGEAGAQNTNETAYTNYARVAVARSGARLPVASNGRRMSVRAPKPLRVCDPVSAT